MNWGYITFRSVTVAQRGEALLGLAGISCALQRTPRWMEEQGCGYCLNLKRKDLLNAVDILRSGGISFRKIYRQGEGDALEEVTL
jgi:hypothetical protein